MAVLHKFPAAFRARRRIYGALNWLCAALICIASGPAFAAGAPQEIAVPAWFKNSFLDLREDVSEARAAGRRVMIYFGQNGCPYCKQLMEVNFRRQDIVDRTRAHIDAIEINIFGSREVTWIDGRTRSEKEFAAALKVQFTPTLLFLDEQGNIALRVNGYYPPERFLAALDYVSGRYEHKVSFAEFSRQGPREGALRDEPYFRAGPYAFDRRGQAARPFAVFFEQPGCSACEELHDTALKAALTRRLLAGFDVYRLDLRSSAAVVTPGGAQSTAREWARALNIAYVPTIVLFDGGGNEVLRIDSYVHAFHLQSALDYVASRAYLKEPSFQRFLQARADAMRARGEHVDLTQ